MLLPDRISHVQVKPRIHPSYDVVVALVLANGDQMSLFLSPEMAARLGRQLVAEVGNVTAGAEKEGSAP